MNKTKVSIVKTGPKPQYPKIRAAVEETLDLIGGVQDIIKPGDLVLVNPQLGGAAGGNGSDFSR